jgi:CDP-diacylglycerol pyrophosphatase
MKSIKKVITAATLMMVLMVGTSFGGVIVHANENPQPCTSVDTSKGGVIMSDMTGVIVHFTGVIVHLTMGVIVHISRTETPVDCGVIVH